MPVLAAIGFLLLCGGLYYVYDRLQHVEASLDPGRVAGIESAQQAQAQKIAQLEQAKPPAPPDLQPLTTRIDSLEKQVSGLAKAPPPPAPAPVAPAGPSPELIARIDSLAGAAQARTDEMAARLAALDKRLADAEQRATQAGDAAAQASQRATQAGDTAAKATQRADQADTRADKIAAEATKLSDQSARYARVQQASEALAAGQPLGEIPGAPVDLVRFAKDPPPTEAALRLSYPDAAARAQEASRPSTENEPIGERMWLRARSLVTVKQGDKVVLGAPAAGILADAQAKLNAGDLAGTVRTLGTLDGSAAAAMADWRGKAQALLDARAALAKMARG